MVFSLKVEQVTLVCFSDFASVTKAQRMARGEDNVESCVDKGSSSTSS